MRFSPSNHALLIDSGYPRRGHHGLWFFGSDNLLRWSEALDNAAWDKWNVVVTPNSTTAPDGTVTADTLAPNAANGNIYPNVGIPVLVLTNYTWSVYLRSTGADRVLDIRIYDAANTVGLASATITVNSVWQRFSVSVNSGANAALYPRIGGGATWSTGEDIYAWGMMLNEGSTALPYVKTTDLQSIPDFLGGPVAIQRGSTVNADTNDPTVTGGYWSHVTDDYGVSPTLPGVNMSGEWTIYFVAKFDGTNLTPLSLADGSSGTEWQRIGYAAAGSIFIGTRHGVPAEIGSGNLTVPANAYVCLTLRSSGGNLMLKRFDTRASVSLANANPTGTPRIGIGVVARVAPISIVDSLKSVAVSLHNVAMTPAEDQWAYRNLKVWSKLYRGVSVE